MMASSRVTMLCGFMGTQVGSVLLVVLNWSVVPASHAHLCKQALHRLVAVIWSCYLQVT